jgi:SAM-dependent methyltransferase
MNRACEPEILDSLPHDHPDAAHNRRDLRIINAVMRNRAWFLRVLRAHSGAGEPILELGAGTGELGAALGRAGFAVDGLDLWPRPARWPQRRAWHQADLRAFGGYGAYPVVIGNLILHQFQDAELAEIGRILRGSARVIAACEPERRRLSQTIMAAVGPVLGASPVTLHDARVSIQAGFQGGELAAALGLSPGEWDVTCATTHLGAYRMVAVRRP